MLKEQNSVWTGIILRKMSAKTRRYGWNNKSATPRNCDNYTHNYVHVYVYHHHLHMHNHTWPVFRINACTERNHRDLGGRLVLYVAITDRDERSLSAFPAGRERREIAWIADVERQEITLWCPDHLGRGDKRRWELGAGSVDQRVSRVSRVDLRSTHTVDVICSRRHRSTPSCCSGALHGPCTSCPRAETATTVLAASSGHRRDSDVDLNDRELICVETPVYVHVCCCWWLKRAATRLPPSPLSSSRPRGRQKTDTLTQQVL